MPVDIHGFTRTHRSPPLVRDPHLRVLDFAPNAILLEDEAAQGQASRCMGCAIPFCHAACPLGNLVPGFAEAVAVGRLQDAYMLLAATNNFPELTGAVCPAPCEASCVLALPPADPSSGATPYGAVTIKGIEAYLAQLALTEGWDPPLVPTRETGYRVGIVGAGPAGLACAQQLRRAGHRVVVFDAADKPGGLARYGIPNFKLAREALDLRLVQLEAEGVEFRCNTWLEPPHAADLRTEFDAVVLATGTPLARGLAVPGEHAHGVMPALEYLRAANRAYASGAASPGLLNAAGKHVVVVGAGDTAADCRGTALRQVAASVTILDHNPEPAGEPIWPTRPRHLEQAYARAEGGVERWGVAVREIHADASDQVTAVQVCPVVAVGRGACRVFRPVGEPEILPADLVLVAVGYTGPDLDLAVALGAAPTASSTIAVDEHFRAGEKLWACGDAQRGASLVVWAIAEGRSAASHIDAALCGETLLPAPLSPHTPSFGL